MADPILPDFFKCQAVFKHISGLPQDVFINNWVFRNDGQIEGGLSGGDAAADKILRVLRAFYTEAEPKTGRSIVSFLSPAVVSPLELRVYNLGQPPPREQIRRELPLPPRSASGYPAEVCATLSYFAGRNLARRRGRIFLGPLGVGVGTMTSDGRVRIDGNFLETVLGRAENVLRTSENVKWCIVSQADAAAHIINNIWMDDAFDTQRRRGEKAGDRRKRAV